jgi:organic radical activating enzyme
MKFKYLKVDAESNLTYCCHAAAPHAVDTNWLNNNPGQLFNTPLLHKERTMMLNNERNSSCEQNCWPAEDKGAVSPRIYQNGQTKTHTAINVQPEEIDFTLTSECNLTCSYCCKEYSSAWKKDLVDNGEYDVAGNRYKLTPRDKVVYKLSQNEKTNSLGYQKLVGEINLITPIAKEFTITGGEPLLNNQLLSIIETAKSCDKIVLYTGLGVSSSRFEKLLNQLTAYTNIELRISAENVGKYLEFNRYGIDATEFDQKVKLIQNSGINYKFHLTLTNLTIFGLAEFYKTFSNSSLIFTFAYQPDFMAINVLDSDSKKQLLDELTILPEKYYNQIVKSIADLPTEEQRINLKTFINKFATRRNLDLNIYPNNFINWINQ